MPATDFTLATSGLDSPFEDGALVTPSDTADLATPARSLWVGGAGNVRVTTLRGTDLLISGVAAGTVLPFRVKRVWATNTTATLIIAGY